MAQFLSDNFAQISFMGAYGNKANFVANRAAFPTMAAADTLDLVRIPGGARLLEGFIVVATAISTATLAIGVRYADGTSTGGTTGTAVLSAGAALTSALTQQRLAFVPFVNDVDTIVYATVSSPQGAAPGANIAMGFSLDYSPEGTK